MPWLSAPDRHFLSAVSRLAYCNVFLPERAELEREALGDRYQPTDAVWSIPVDEPERTRPNIDRIVARLAPILDQLRQQLRVRGAGTLRDDELVLYEDGVLHLLYQRYYPRLLQAFYAESGGSPAPGLWSFYREFRADWSTYFEVDGVRLPSGHEPRHTFACFRQIQRAFDQIYAAIVGNSLPAARLRAAIWQSIFTHDIRRYRRTLFERMGDFATLITGPSGSGKELVARAIGHSRYVPFDERRLAFVHDGTAAFFPINISALSPTLVESELFGHKRGAFTGAVADRKGWLETCPPLGSVFLDELGDLDPAIQVKLLRVIETRSFHAVGETAARQFRGKLIAATNRDLAADIQSGRFREDLYYRLCSDQIVTPSLADQIAASPGVLRDLVVFMARKVAGAEAGALVPEVLQWIGRNLEPGYAWPGNYRELEQLVKNVLIRRDYRPARARPADAATAFFDDFRAGRLTADQVMSEYCRIVYSQTGSYQETARRIGLDRRTVKARIESVAQQS